MRTNLPVTQREHLLHPDTTLVSVTDPKGRIVYCNPAFAEASGFDETELLGQPHNLVRHPDMPEEAFRDLWHTIGSGKPWSGLVKNRRKNGDYYWVLANATPMRSDGEVVGYLSVRTTPAREQVEASEALYATMREQEAEGKLSIGLLAGEVVGKGPVARVLRFLKRAPARLGWGGALWMLTVASLIALARVAEEPLVLWAAAAMAGVALAVFRHLEARPYRRVLEDTLQLAAGDLVHNVRKDGTGLSADIGVALSQLAVNLRSVTGDIRTEAMSVQGGAEEIAAGNEDLSARTEAQAANLQQTAASMEEINGTIKHSAASASEGARLATQAVDAAKRCSEGVEGVVDAMSGINESSRRIGEIIGVIEGIAFQTNILALNAAVEAARAGEQGRGFAVVAGEVRTLAQRTTAAAREVKSLVEDSVGRAAAGQDQTQLAKERMSEAVGVVSQVSQLLSQIDVAANEQRMGVSQVNTAVAELDSITQQNAAMVEQLAAAARTLRQQVEVVDKSTSVFRLKQGGRTVAEVDAVKLRRDARDAGARAEKPFELSDAIESHVQWKARLRNAAAHGSELDPKTISRDDCCALGKWLHGDGRARWGGLPQFTALVEQHASFHKEAGRVAGLVMSGDKDGAMQALANGSVYAKATQSTLLAITALQNAQGAVSSSATARPAAETKATRESAEDDWVAI
ncbi:methyl-accepting chemotaxis protein [Hydrogenophaga sp. 5NK40-0174]|uniref:methyl-accepting chemotaxis protein n=1 Tax=Hydrogenophaga sp. 5NK40-0174 TaxID=3127649 RepID=UPI003101F7D7